MNWTKMTQLKALGNPHILKAPHGAFWRNKKPPSGGFTK